MEDDIFPAGEWRIIGTVRSNEQQHNSDSLAASRRIVGRRHNPSNRQRRAGLFSTAVFWRLATIKRESRSWHPSTLPFTCLTGTTMIRALFLAIGVTLLLLAAECSLLDRVELRQAAAGSSDAGSQSAVEVSPPTGSTAVLLIVGILIVLGSWRASNRRVAAGLETATRPLDPATDSTPAATITAADELLAREEGELAACQALAASQAADDNSFFDDDDDSFFDDDDDDLD